MPKWYDSGRVPKRLDTTAGQQGPFWDVKKRISFIDLKAGRGMLNFLFIHHILYGVTLDFYDLKNIINFGFLFKKCCWLSHGVGSVSVCIQKVKSFRAVKKKVNGQSLFEKIPVIYYTLKWQTLPSSVYRYRNNCHFYKTRKSRIGRIQNLIDL